MFLRLLICVCFSLNTFYRVCSGIKLFYDISFLQVEKPNIRPLLPFMFELQSRMLWTFLSTYTYTDEEEHIFCFLTSNGIGKYTILE